MSDLDDKQHGADTEPKFDPQETEGESGPNKPWDPTRIRVNTKAFSLRGVVDDIAEQTIDLAPDFQREYIWKDRQKTLLIESILLGIPLPAFYFDATPDNTFLVVDGVQRLSTIRDFATGQFPLSEDLEYLKDLEGKTLASLDAPLRRRFNQTQIVVHVIEPTSPADLKYDIFKRINTGGSPLTPQEIRHCMSRGRSRTFLKKLSQFSSFKETTRLGSVKRMEDRALVLRFVSFYRLVEADPSLEDYAKYDTLDSFLLQNTIELDDQATVPEAELRNIEAAFDSGLKNAQLVFGSQAFRKVGTSSLKQGPLNRALFESWTVALADLDSASLAPVASAICDAATEELSKNGEYVNAVTYSTGKPEQVKRRFKWALEIVQKALP